MDGSGITLRGELVHMSPAGLVLRARGGQVIEVPASAVLRTSMENGAVVVDLTPSAQLVVRSPEDRGRFLSSDIFGRITVGNLLEGDGDEGGGGGNCNCNCSGGNCNCNCNCSSIAELPRLRRQLQ